MSVSIFKTYSRGDLFDLLESFIQINRDWFEDKSNCLYGKMNKVKMYLFNSINSRHLIEDHNDPDLIYCSIKFEEFVVAMEGQCQ